MKLKVLLSAAVLSTSFIYPFSSSFAQTQLASSEPVLQEADSLDEPATSAERATKKIVRGSLESVACFTSGTLAVRNENLDEVIFRVKPNLRVKVFQGWGDNVKKKKISGKVYTFSRVQFLDREEEDSVGWIPDAYIKPKSECAGTSDDASEPTPPKAKIPAKTQKPGKQQPKSDDSEDQVTPAPKAPKNQDSGLGLQDDSCCRFPLGSRPTETYLSGARKFSSGRSGRLHAACDLYLHKNEPIYSVAPGKVVRDMYFFYQGTYALEVRHSGGFIARYGELTGKKAASIASNKSVTSGQVVGYMGKVDSNCCEPMLHFELYSGKASGSLTQSGNQYMRRSDLLNPTKYLLKWEENTFSGKAN